MAKTKNSSTNINWNTIHIFGYGETQLNGIDFSKKYSTTDLTKVQDVIDNVLKLKPTEVESSDLHCINIFKDEKAVFMSSVTFDSNYTIDYAQLDVLKIEALVEEIFNLPENQA